ncbi:MAG: polysaccharide deacetylase family protein [Phycisphaerae bacterium]
MFGNLFKRLGKGDSGAKRELLPIDRPTVGLCFDYERGIAYDSQYLSDIGLDLILKALKQHSLRATFNCPAKLCETSPDQLSMIADAGHEIAVLGYADETPADLTPDAIKQLVYTCRNAYARRGLNPTGFRVAKSKWDDRLTGEMAAQGFLYNAEHDHSRHLYVLSPGSPPLVRIPIYTDDRGLRRGEDTYDTTVSKHLRLIRKAIQHTCFVSICFHPWIMAEDMERFEHWQIWLTHALKGGAKVCAMEDALPAEYRTRETPGQDQ